jgi:hypothetical protein
MLSIRHVPGALLGAVVTSALPALLFGGPVLAQVSDANVRAVNTARNWAVNANGGLSVYVPASCMFETANGGGSCLVNSTPQGFFFRFVGGTPGWQVEGRPPSLETQIQVSPDGRSVVNVPYNGAPR